MKILYKRDSRGKIRIWQIYTQGALLIQESGLEDGKLVKHQKFCTPKNIGKSNGTDCNQQALLEMDSLIKQKLDEGYFETKELAESEKVILPMLAKSYDDEKHKIDWSKNVFIQPKLDGQRCLAFIKSNGDVKLMSRDGKIIENMQHIIDDLSNIKQDIILDGELYAHGLSFQENMKLIKKYRKGESELIKYHVYDVISDKSYNTRHSLICKNLIFFKTVELVETTPCKSESDLKISHSLNINDGFEGSIIRHGEEGYKVNGRSSNLLKYKDFKDMDLPIYDIEPNDANPLHGTPLFTLGLHSKFFKAGCKLSHADREDLLTNKDEYIGKIATIRYFELTDDGIPRFPVMVGIRNDLN